MYGCICECGNYKKVRGDSLGKGTNSCGCLQKESRRRDINPGTKYGRLVVLERTEHQKHNAYMYKCICDCGTEKLIRSDMLRGGSVKSCGCLHDELFYKNRTKHMRIILLRALT